MLGVVGFWLLSFVPFFGPVAESLTPGSALYQELLSPPESYPSDIKSHRVCAEGPGSCIEILELKSKNPSAPPALLVPGFFHSYRIFDLQESGASYARYLRDQIGLNVFFLHPRGYGRSDRPSGKDVTLDSIASEDLEWATQWIVRRTSQRLLLIGHSQGSIESQAFASGLKNGHFSEVLARERADRLVGLVLLTGNPAMQSADPKRDDLLGRLATLGVRLAPSLERLGWIPARALARHGSPPYVDGRTISWGPFLFVWVHPLSGRYSLAHQAWLWKFLFEPSVLNDHENNGESGKTAWITAYTHSLETTSSGIIAQFIDGILNGGIRTQKQIPYLAGIRNISTRTAQILFEHDPLADPNDTQARAFSQLGSRFARSDENKKIWIFPAQGHEDFFLSQKLSDLHTPVYHWVLSPLRSRR